LLMQVEINALAVQFAGAAFAIEAPPKPIPRGIEGSALTAACRTTVVSCSARDPQDPLLIVDRPRTKPG